MRCACIHPRYGKAKGIAMFVYGQSAAPLRRQGKRHNAVGIVRQHGADGFCSGVAPGTCVLLRLAGSRMMDGIRLGRKGKQAARAVKKGGAGAACTNINADVEHIYPPMVRQSMPPNRAKVASSLAEAP